MQRFFLRDTFSFPSVPFFPLYWTQKPVILSPRSPGHIWTDFLKLWIRPSGQVGGLKPVYFVAEWMECTWLWAAWHTETADLAEVLRFQRTGLTTNTSNICKTNTPGLPGEDTREPNGTLDLRTRKHRCFLNLCSKSSMEIACHPLTRAVESLWVPCSATLWYLIKGPDVSAEKLNSCQGKPWSEEAVCVI